MVHAEWEFPKEWKGSTQVKFLEHSKNRRFLATPDIVDFREDTMGKPVFDLILGMNTLNEKGVKLTLNSS